MLLLIPTFFSRAVITSMNKDFFLSIAFAASKHCSNRHSPTASKSAQHRAIIMQSVETFTSFSCTVLLQLRHACLIRGRSRWVQSHPTPL